MDNAIKLIDILIWPLCLLMIYFFNHKIINDVIKSLMERIKQGAEIDIKGVVIGSIPNNLPVMKDKKEITKDYFALIHASWRYPKKDLEFKKRMYCIQVIIQAQQEVLDEVEFVKYYLHNSYPNPIQTKHDKKNHFELKELAWGEYLLKAEVKLKESNNVIQLERYINLTETGNKLIV